MTRKDLISRINAYVSTYLGFSTEQIGIGARNKQSLEALERGYGRMIEIQAEAKVLKGKFTRNHIDYMCMTGDKEPEYIQAERLFAQAQRLWHAGTKALIAMDTEFGGDWSKYGREG